MRQRFPGFFAAALAVGQLGFTGTAAQAAEYQIDPGHSFVQFRIKHLGYSWLFGRFNGIEGQFSYDADTPESASISIDVDPASIDSNHAERDKHLRSEDFLDVAKQPKASFKSTGYSGNADEGTLAGDLSINGVTAPISLTVKKIGEGKDPWGGYRAGFSGVLELTRKDFGMDYNLGPDAETMELEIGIEGIRQ